MKPDTLHGFADELEKLSSMGAFRFWRGMVGVKKGKQAVKVRQAALAHAVGQEERAAELGVREADRMGSLWR
jgi:hypothetical protein